MNEDKPVVGHIYINKATGRHAVVVESVNGNDVSFQSIRVPLEKGGEHGCQWMFTPNKEDAHGWIPWMRFIAEFRRVSG